MTDDRTYYQRNRVKILKKRAEKRKPLIEQERKIKEITLNMSPDLLVQIIKEKMKNGE